MKTCGIVAEYNPFHNGHLYHIEKTKQVTNADAIVCVMSGNFIQRGLPALFDKWTRAKMALNNGVDLVLELPTIYATASAEYFAHGAINLLDALGVIDTLSFGNSCNDIEILKRIANVLYLEPEGYQKELKAELKKGNSYPVSRSNALKNFLKKEFKEDVLSSILLDSNNILGIEYLKALLSCNSNITPISIERVGSSYNSLQISNNICSATAIREMLEHQQIEFLPDVLPSTSLQIIRQEITSGKMPMFLKNFETEILFALRKLSIEELSQIADVSEGMEYTIKKNLLDYYTIEDFIEAMKSKRYTGTRIQRLILHALLGITQEMLDNYKQSPQYVRVLAFNKTGEKVLSKISSRSHLPIITSVNKFLKVANDNAKKMLEIDILASNIYTLGYQVPDFRKVNLDYTKTLVTNK